MLRPGWLLAALGLAVVVIAQKIEENDVGCDTSPIDVTFLLDVNAKDEDAFALQRFRVLSVLRHLESSTKGRSKSYSLIAFKRTPITLLELASPFSHSPEKVNSLLMTIRPTISDGVDTSVAMAMEAAATQFMQDGKENSRRLVFLIHDGLNTDLVAETLEAMSSLEKQEATVFAIGAGEPNTHALQGYSGDRLRVMAVDQDRILFNAAIDEVTGACGGESSEGPVNPVFVEKSRQLQAKLFGIRARDELKKKKKFSTEQPCSQQKVDLMIVLDTSGSVFNAFKEERQQAIDLINSFSDDAYIENIQISVIRFSSNAEVVVPFKLGTPKEDILKVVREIPFTGESTRIATAVSMGIEELERHQRADARQVFVLISDGHGQEYWSVVQSTGRKLQETDWEVFSVTASRDFNFAELMLYAGDDNRVFVGPKSTSFIPTLTGFIGRCIANSGKNVVIDIKQITTTKPIPVVTVTEAATVAETTSTSAPSKAPVKVTEKSIEAIPPQSTTGSSTSSEVTTELPETSESTTAAAIQEVVIVPIVSRKSDRVEEAKRLAKVANKKPEKEEKKEDESTTAEPVTVTLGEIIKPVKQHKEEEEQKEETKPSEKEASKEIEVPLPSTTPKPEEVEGSGEEMTAVTAHSDDRKVTDEAEGSGFGEPGVIFRDEKQSSVATSEPVAASTIATNDVSTEGTDSAEKTTSGTSETTTLLNSSEDNVLSSNSKEAKEKDPESVVTSEQTTESTAAATETEAVTQPSTTEESVSSTTENSPTSSDVVTTTAESTTSEAVTEAADKKEEVPKSEFSADKSPEVASAEKSDCEVDVILVVDRSQSVDDDYNKELATAVDAVNQATEEDYASGRVRVGAVSFARDAAVELPLRRNSLQNATDVIRKIIHTGGTTSAVSGVDLASRVRGLRPKCAKTLIIPSNPHLTNSNSSYNAVNLPSESLTNKRRSFVSNSGRVDVERLAGAQVVDSSTEAEARKTKHILDGGNDRSTEATPALSSVHTVVEDVNNVNGVENGDDVTEPTVDITKLMKNSESSQFRSNDQDEDNDSEKMKQIVADELSLSPTVQDEVKSMETTSHPGNVREVEDEVPVILVSSLEEPETQADAPVQVVNVDVEIPEEKTTTTTSTDVAENVTDPFEIPDGFKPNIESAAKTVKSEEPITIDEHQKIVENVVGQEEKRVDVEGSGDGSGDGTHDQNSSMENLIDKVFGTENPLFGLGMLNSTEEKSIENIIAVIEPEGSGDVEGSGGEGSGEAMETLDRIAQQVVTTINDDPNLMLPKKKSNRVSASKTFDPLRMDPDTINLSSEEPTEITLDAIIKKTESMLPRGSELPKSITNSRMSPGMIHDGSVAQMAPDVPHTVSESLTIPMSRVHSLQVDVTSTTKTSKDSEDPTPQPTSEPTFSETSASEATTDSYQKVASTGVDMDALMDSITNSQPASTSTSSTSSTTISTTTTTTKSQTATSTSSDEDYKDDFKDYESLVSGASTTFIENRNAFDLKKYTPAHADYDIDDNIKPTPQTIHLPGVRSELPVIGVVTTVPPSPPQFDTPTFNKESVPGSSSTPSPGYSPVYAGIAGANFNPHAGAWFDYNIANSVPGKIQNSEVEATTDPLSQPTQSEPARAPQLPQFDTTTMEHPAGEKRFSVDQPLWPFGKSDSDDYDSPEVPSLRAFASNTVVMGDKPAPLPKLRHLYSKPNVFSVLSRN